MGNIYFKQFINNKEVYYTSTNLKKGYPILGFITGKEWVLWQKDKHISKKQLPLL